MFNIETVKYALGIDSEKTEIEQHPHAINAIPAINCDSEAKNSRNSTNSIPPPLKNEKLRNDRSTPHCVRCLDCKHFTRSDHPHLGKCAAGVNQSAPAGFWDTHLRGCQQFTDNTGCME